MISLKSFNLFYRFRRFRLWMVTRHPGVLTHVAQISNIEDKDVPQRVREILRETGEIEDIAESTIRFLRGAEYQRKRLSEIADFCANHYPGDFIEIGAFKGETTAILGRIAEQYGRRVMVVDPWETGTQNCEGEEYSAFKETASSFASIIDVVRLSSLSEKAKKEMLRRDFSFALVDGLHTYDACLSDILSVNHCKGIIAVDDLGVMHIRDELVPEHLIPTDSIYDSLGDSQDGVGCDSLRRLIR